MEKGALETVGQYSAYGIVIIIAFLKVVISSYTFIKGLINKGTEKDKEKSVVVNDLNIDNYYMFW